MMSSEQLKHSLGSRLKILMKRKQDYQAGQFAGVPAVIHYLDGRINELKAVLKFISEGKDDYHAQL